MGVLDLAKAGASRASSATGSAKSKAWEGYTAIPSKAAKTPNTVGRVATFGRLTGTLATLLGLVILLFGYEYVVSNGLI